MTVYLLPDEPVFPLVAEAEPDGLVAIGGDLSAERLIQAYAHGIFPWFSDDGDVFWYSPDPRMVLFPADLNVSHSLRRVLRSGRYWVSFDTVFEQVIRACAEVQRPDHDGTWISEDFIEAYTRLHVEGFAHSVEVFDGDRLVGGLYGVSLGAAFFGESMFYRESNASKVALATLAEWCRRNSLQFIDCQVETSHLRRLGATNVTRPAYLNMLKKALAEKTVRAPWK
ncbi:MAG TPA: leucyl/phenylalanyl-tRNA--protein transferase [Bacteroidales bacterium]|nr:leucyl/phenylalanyl-tRNA--protein transferase [Bacteroidales bacterium]